MKYKVEIYFTADSREEAETVRHILSMRAYEATQYDVIAYLKPVDND